MPKLAVLAPNRDTLLITIKRTWFQLEDLFFFDKTSGPGSSHFRTPILGGFFLKA
jgi:hypothetical protein